MRAIQFEEFGPPINVLKLIEKPDPEPKEDEVRVKMTYRTINPSDLYYISGNYGIKPNFPAVPGFEGTGFIDKLGSNVKKFEVGQKVIPIGVSGTWSEYLIANTNQLIPVPAGLKEQSAAQLLINVITAWLLILEELKLKKDQYLLQTAAGSTLGRVVLQIAKMKGIKTINFVRRRAQIKELLDLGADYVICTEDKDVVEQVMKITGEGAHGAIDAVGGKTGSLALNSLRHQGTLIVYGLLSNTNMSINTGEMIFKETNIRGFWLSRWLLSNPLAKIQSILSELMQLIIEGKIEPPVEAEYELDDFKEAIKHSMRSGRRGKVLLKN